MGSSAAVLPPPSPLERRVRRWKRAVSEQTRRSVSGKPNPSRPGSHPPHPLAKPANAASRVPSSGMVSRQSRGSEALEWASPRGASVANHQRADPAGPGLPRYLQPPLPAAAAPRLLWPSASARTRDKLEAAKSTKHPPHSAGAASPTRDRSPTLVDLTCGASSGRKRPSPCFGRPISATNRRPSSVLAEARAASADACAPDRTDRKHRIVLRRALTDNVTPTDTRRDSRRTNAHTNGFGSSVLPPTVTLPRR